MVITVVETKPGTISSLRYLDSSLKSVSAFSDSNRVSSKSVTVTPLYLWLRCRDLVES